MNSVITVLIVDDNLLTLEIIKGYFESTEIVEFKCITLDDPLLVIEKTIEHKPDFIVLDVFMPKRNGLNVCEDLFNNPETSQIPVMFLTSSESLDDRGKAFLFGSIAYFRKGDDIQDMIRTIILHDSLTPIRKALDRLSSVTKEVESNYHHQ